MGREGGRMEEIWGGFSVNVGYKDRTTPKVIKGNISFLPWYNQLFQSMTIKLIKVQIRDSCTTCVSEYIEDLKQATGYYELVIDDYKDICYFMFNKPSDAVLFKTIYG